MCYFHITILQLNKKKKRKEMQNDEEKRTVGR